VSGDYKEILLALIGERPPPAPVPEEEDAGEPELEEVEEEHIEVCIYLLFFLHVFKVTVLCLALLCLSLLWKIRVKTDTSSVYGVVSFVNGKVHYCHDESIFAYGLLIGVHCMCLCGCVFVICVT